MKTFLLALLFALIPIVSNGAYASGGGSAPSLSQTTVQKSPTERAVDSYNAGLKNRDKAWKYLDKATVEKDTKKAAKLHKKADKQFARAIKKYKSAIKNEPRLYQAHGALGYALKQVGDFDGAMMAYDQCLKLRPKYTPAIEYRGEAYLALGLFAEAPQAYDRLEKLDPKKAGELSLAFHSWAKSPPEDLDAELVTNMQRWIAENISS